MYLQDPTYQNRMEVAQTIYLQIKVFHYVERRLNNQYYQSYTEKMNFELR